MTGFQGANTEQLRAHAERMSTNAQALMDLRDRLDPIVRNEEIWRGSDAEAFRSSWASGAATLFQLRADEIRRSGDDLNVQAEEQDRASSVGGEGGANGGGGQGGGENKSFNPLMFLKDLAVKGQTVFSKAKSLVDYLGRIPTAADEFAQLAERGLDGLWKATYLDEVFKGGKGWQAGAEKLLGKLGLPTSIGNFEPLKALNKLDDVAPWLKTGGKFIGKALPFLDIGFGAMQIKDAVANGDWYSGISGGLSVASGSLVLAAPFTGPAAPIVAGIGVGLGLVSAGMDLGKLVYDNWDGITSTVSNAANAVTSFADNAAQAAGDALGKAADTASEGLSNVASTVSDGLGKVGKAFGL